MACGQIALSACTEFEAVSASHSNSLLVLAHLRAPELQLQEGKERAPISVSAVIDRSGSMEGTKMALTKATLRFVISNFTAKDEFGIISYASDVKETLKLQKMDAAGRRQALQAVDAITPDGCTNLSGGLFAGIDQLKGIPIPVQTEDTRRRGPAWLMQRMQPIQSVLPVGPTVSLQVGNECTMGASGPTSWKLFVRLGDGMIGVISDFVEHVAFLVSASGLAVTLAQAPFELDRTEQVAFPVEVRVKMTPAHGGMSHTFHVTPNFSSPITFCTVQVPIVAQSIPAITTTPPSQPPQAEQAVSSALRNDVTAVWLFTDGLANEGIQDQAELVKETEQRLQGMVPPCTIFTFGFGEDHNAQMLKDVADAGKGMYYYVQSDAAIVEAFADCLGGLMSVVARNLKLTAIPSVGVVPKRLFTPYSSHVAADEAWVVIPDMYCEEERDIILEVEVGPVNPPQDAPGPIIEWRVEYHNLLTDQDETSTACAELARPTEAPVSQPHPLLDQQRNRVRVTDAIQQARGHADRGKLAAAQQLLDEAMRAIETSPTAGNEFCVGYVEDLRDCRAELVSEDRYHAYGSKTMMSAECCHGYQRSCGMKNKYVNSAKAQMMADFSSNVL